MIKLKLESFLNPACLGMEISDTFIRISTPNGRSVQTLATDDKLQALKQVIKKAKIKNPQVAISIPEKYSFIDLVKRGVNSEKSIIKESIPLPIEKIYYDSQEVDQYIFIVAAVRKVVDQYLELTEKTGLIAVAVEPASLAIARALKPNNGHTLIINVEEDGTSFIITSPEFVYFTAFRSKIDLPGKERIVDQASSYINFFEDRYQQKIQTIMISGEHHGFIDKNLLNEKTKKTILVAKNPVFSTTTGLLKRSKRKQ